MKEAKLPLSITFPPLFFGLRTAQPELFKPDVFSSGTNVLQSLHELSQMNNLSFHIAKEDFNIFFKFRYRNTFLLFKFLPAQNFSGRCHSGDALLQVMHAEPQSPFTSNNFWWIFPVLGIAAWFRWKSRGGKILCRTVTFPMCVVPIAFHIYTTWETLAFQHYWPLPWLSFFRRKFIPWGTRVFQETTWSFVLVGFLWLFQTLWQEAKWNSR